MSIFKDKVLINKSYKSVQRVSIATEKENLIIDSLLVEFTLVSFCDSILSTVTKLKINYSQPN